MVQGRCRYRRTKWIITHLGGGEYQLQSHKTGLCVDLTGGSTADGANAQQWSCDGSAVQRFVLVPTG